jgi:DNA-binding transcriptional MocR family regulator
MGVTVLGGITLLSDFMEYDNTMLAAESNTTGNPSAIHRLLEHLEHDVIAVTANGDRLPSVRNLVKRYQVSPVTVSRALTELTRRGLIVTRPGNGTFVTRASETPRVNASERDLAWQSVALGARAFVPEEMQVPLLAPRAGLLPLGTGYPDSSLLPHRELERAMLRAAKRPELWARVPVEGLEALRTWFAQELGSDARAEDVLIVPGGQAAVSTTLRAIIAPGEAVLFESPTYFGALAVAQSAGLRAIPVPTDANGIRPDLLEAAFKTSNAKALYLQPLYTNPTGVVLEESRRAQVLEIAARANAFVIEDDYARDFTLDGQAPPPLWTLAPERVIYLRSLTKSSAPGLRIAGIVALGPVMQRLRLSRMIDDMFVAGALQAVALEFVTSPTWRKHLARVREALRSRRDAALVALEQHFPQARVTGVPKGGFSLWLELPKAHTPEMDETAFVLEAAKVGVQLSAGRAWFPAEASGSFLRLSFAAADEHTLEEGIARLGRVWQTGFGR